MESIVSKKISTTDELLRNLFQTVLRMSWLEKFLWMEMNVISARSLAKFTYLTLMKALTIQKPHILPGKVIALRGPEGTGKDFSIHNGFDLMFGGNYRYMQAK